MKITAVHTDAAPEAGTIAPEKLISGEAATNLWHAFSDSTDRFHVGHWASGPCAITVDYSESELCVIVEGRVTLADEAGNEVSYKVGDAFVIEAGFKGTWTSQTDVKKIYASFE